MRMEKKERGGGEVRGQKETNIYTYVHTRLCVYVYIERSSYYHNPVVLSFPYIFVKPAESKCNVVLEKISFPLTQTSCIS